MLHSLIHFSTLAAGLLAEEHPPAEAEGLMTINLGLAPFGVIVVTLLVIAVAWVALNAQAERADLHAAAEHHDGGHDAHGH